MPLTVSEAINIFERTFRARNPNEIERVLRENINVQVAVIDSRESAKNKINEGYYPLTVRIPYGVFISKVKERELKVYSLEQENMISRESKKWRLEEVRSPNEILPNKTYFLLKDEAGYHPDLGLAFDGKGEVTGFEKIKGGEKAEKFGIGKEQTWEEHAVGAYSRADRILKIYRPFLIDWTENVFSIQNLNEKQINDTTDAVTLAIKISVLLHDIGKLRKEWQEAVGWKAEQPYIARTSGRYRVPFHAPYAYPFLKTILRDIFGEYRFLDTIALAIARHHSLEVTGAVRENDFKLIDKKVVELLNLLLRSITELKTYSKEELIQHSIEVTNRGSLMDEPPSPSDDFYFIYAITNRVVKLADWEDAGDEIIELPKNFGEKE
jgi:CRISPR-associated endonuclease Cas3-HD